MDFHFTTKWCMSVQIGLFLVIHNFSFLSTGDSFGTLKAKFRVGKSTIHNIIIEICSAIWDVIQPIYMPEPTIEDWLRIEKEFATR